MRRSLVLALLVVLMAALVPARAVHAADDPLPAPLPAPVLVTPVGGTAASLDLELRWLRVSGATSYRLQVFHGDPDGYPLVDEITVNDRWFGRVQQTSGTLWWQVSALDEAGTAGDAAHATFTVADPAPEALWPPDGATITHPAETPVLAWRSTYYYEALYEDQDVGAASPPSSLPGQLVPGTWRWRVAPTPSAHPGLPDPTATSGTRTFTWTWPDSAPALTLPPDDAHVDAGAWFRLAWAPVEGASGYAWEVDDGDGNRVAHGDGVSAQLATWADVSTVLQPGTYTWRVHARLAGTDWSHEVFGDWSAERGLTVDPWPAPVQTLPADDALLDTWPMLRWDPVPGAEAYQVQVTSDLAGYAPAREVAVPAAAFGSYTLTGDALGADPGRSTRYWRVRARQPGMYAAYGPWSDWRTFTVKQTGGIGQVTGAPQVSPADCPDESCPDFPGLPILRWTEVPGAVVYRVFVAWNGDPAAFLSWFDTGGTVMPLPFTNSSQGGRTSWAVVACPSTTDCPTTMPDPAWHFRVTLPVPVVEGPADGSAIQGPAAEVAWQPVPALPAGGDVLAPPITYTLHATPELGGQPGFLFDQDRGMATAGTLEGVADGMTMTWQVRADGAASGLRSAWSAPHTFTRTEPSLVISGPDPAVPQGPLPLLDWDGPPYPTAGYQVQVARADDTLLYGDWYYRWTFYASGTSVRPSFPLPPGDYHWRVRRNYAIYHVPQEGDGPWTEGAFTVAGDSDIALVSPAPGASAPADGVVLEWSALTDGLEQELQVPGYVVIVGTDPALPWASSYHWYTDTPRHAVQIRLPEGPVYWKACSALACSAVGSLSTGVSPVRALTVLKALGGPDAVDPVMTARPKVVFADNVGITTRARVDASWAATDSGTGVDHFDLRLYRDGVMWRERIVDVSTASFAVAAGHRWQVRVRPVDAAGNTGAWSSSRTFSVASRQDTSSAIRWKGTWHTRTAARWWGGTARSSSDAGATTTTSVTGRGVALVSALGPGRGVARVYVDGKLVARVPLEASTLSARRVVWATTWSSTTTHSVRVKVEARPAGAARVDVDAFMILR